MSYIPGGGGGGGGIETHITCDFPVSPSESAHEDTSIRGLN